MSKKQLNGSTVIVTGVTGGLGRDIAELLLKEYECSVIGIAHSEEKAKKLKERFCEYGERFIYRCFDVGEKESWRELANWLTQSGIQPDMLINNAGILPKFDKFSHYDDAEIKRVMDTNFFSCVWSAQALLPLLQQSKKGGIVNISSSAALAPLPGTALYSASKGAVKNFTECLREEMAGKLYVGLVCPGFTRTDIFRYQEGIKNDSLIYAIATNCRRMAKKIVKGIDRQKKRMVFGADAKLMDKYTRLACVRSLRVYRKVMKISGVEMFSHVFEEK